jgi:hypothetical protein
LYDRIVLETYRQLLGRSVECRLPPMSTQQYTKMARKRGNDPSTGSNAKNGKKTCVMGNIWEMRLTGSDYERLDKAFKDHCRDKNITPKDFFLRWNDDERAAGWKEIVDKLPSDLVDTIRSIMAESSGTKTATKTNKTAAQTIPPAATAGTTTTGATTMTPVAANTPTNETTAQTIPPTGAADTTNMPNLTNDIMFAGLFGLSDSDKKKFKKSQVKALRKVKHGIQIIEENKELLHEHRDLGIVLTTPERKPAVIFDDNFRPGVKLGDYVKVEGDSSPGNNRPAGCGFVTAVKGVGAATIATVAYSPNRQCHSKEPKAFLA